jgi:uncharacterized protein (DUF433 family)
VLKLLASGLRPEQIVEELPDLETEDIFAVLRYASGQVNHVILKAA